AGGGARAPGLRLRPRRARGRAGGAPRPEPPPGAGGVLGRARGAARCPRPAAVRRGPVLGRCPRLLGGRGALAYGTAPSEGTRMPRTSPARPWSLRARRAGGGVRPRSAGRRAPALAAALGLLGIAPSAGAAAAPTPPFGLDQVAERARQLASRPFEDPHGQVPRWLLELTYDQWRKIRFRPEM